MISFGKNLCRHREKLNISRAELARNAGISLSMLFKIEKGETTPTITIANKIAQCLNITISELLDEKPKGHFHVGTLQIFIEKLNSTDKQLEEIINFRMKLEPQFRAHFPRTYVFDKDIRYLFASSFGSQLHGLTPADLIGKHWKEIGLPVEAMEAIEKKIKHVFLHGVPVTDETFFPTMSEIIYIQYRLTPLNSEDGITEAVMATVWNITKEKLVEQYLLNHGDRLSQFLVNSDLDMPINLFNILAIFINSCEATLLTTPNGRIIDANPAACKLFRMSHRELLCAGREGVVDQADPQLALALRNRENSGFAVAELQYFCKDGTRFLGETTSNIFKTKTGELYTCMIIRDVTNRQSK